MNIMNATEARAQSEGAIRKSSNLLNFFNKVDIVSTSGVTSMYFDIGGRMEDDEVRAIDALGYNIRWNGACLWYEVSW